MTYIIQIKPSGYLLFVEEEETVLGAALKQGYEFPYSCGSATCGTCMGKVLEGSFTYGNIEPFALDESAREDGFALFCSVQPTSDMIIEVEDVYGPEYLPIRRGEYQATKLVILTDDVYQFFLTPMKKQIQYHAGQYLKIICDNGAPVPFSIANAPSEDGTIELQVKDNGDNPYTTEIIEKVKNKENLLLRGPYGTVRYYEELSLPIIFVVGGTGIVPIKALIEEILSKTNQQELHLYWGGSSTKDLYLLKEMQELETQHANFTFTPVVSKKDEFWAGRHGLVHEIAVQEHEDFSQHQVYASGPTDMVYAAFDAFTAKGLKPQLMYSDTFECFPRES